MVLIESQKSRKRGDSCQHSRKEKFSRSVSMPIKFCENRRSNVTTSNTYTKWQCADMLKNMGRFVAINRNYCLAYYLM